MSNLWRIVSKNGGINGKEAFLRDVVISKDSGTDVREWRSRLLHVAIRDDKITVVRLLLELGADAKCVVGGRTALHTAAFRRDPRFVEALFGVGADHTLHDHSGCTALHQAILNSFEETAAALVAGGAGVSIHLGPSTVRDPLAKSKSPERKTSLMLLSGFDQFSQKLI
jgi:ankyrin repeat protein